MRFARLRGFCLALLAIALPAAAQTPAGPPPDRQAIEAIVRDYLLKNPEVIESALEELQRRREETAAVQQRLAVAALSQELLSDATAPVLGNPKGNVTIVEFSDYRCTYCKRVHPALVELLRRDGNVRLVIKEFPILGPESVVAAKAALAANRQGRYAALHERLMAFKGALSQDAILAAARDAGLDIKRLQADMESPEVAAALQRNHQLAGKLEINGTPGFVIGDKVVPGALPLAQIEELVRAVRARL